MDGRGRVREPKTFQLIGALSEAAIMDARTNMPWMAEVEFVSSSDHGRITKRLYEAAVVKSQAMDGRGSARDIETDPLIGALNDAAIRDDRIKMAYIGHPRPTEMPP
jgi:hypothetical protein